MLLDFDDEVESFEVQPVRIPVPGVPQGYVPDVLVRYTLASGRPPLLAEVKHTGEIERHAVKLAPKFAAARAFADEQGWEFRVVDETMIRTPRLTNLKFLREFRNVELSESELGDVLRLARTVKPPLSVNRLVDAMAASLDDRLHWLPRIWAAVLQGRLLVDMDQPFGEDVALQLVPDRP